MGLLHPDCGHIVLTDSAPLPVPSFLTCCPRAEGQGKCVTGNLSAAFGHGQGNSKEWIGQ